MKIKIFLISNIIFALLSCTKDNKKPIDVFTYNDEIFVGYQKKENYFKVAKILEHENDSATVFYYELNIGVPEGLKQQSVFKEKIARLEVAKTEQNLKQKFSWKPFSGDDVLFVQIQPKGFKDEFEILDKRQEVEEEISTALKSKNLGEWFAGDIGPGGGNMLYTIFDLNEAMKVTLQVLAENNLTKNVVIGKRVMISNEDWFYEAIYPENFSGTFNTM